MHIVIINYRDEFQFRIINRVGQRHPRRVADRCIHRPRKLKAQPRRAFLVPGLRLQQLPPRLRANPQLPASRPALEQLRAHLVPWDAARGIGLVRRQPRMQLLPLFGRQLGHDRPRLRGDAVPDLGHQLQPLGHGERAVVYPCVAHAGRIHQPPARRPDCIAASDGFLHGWPTPWGPGSLLAAWHKSRRSAFIVLPCFVLSLRSTTRFV